MVAEANISDMNDSEVKAIGKVMAWVYDQQGQRRDAEGFRQEVIERFDKIGFEVEVLASVTNVEGMLAYDINIVRRTKGEFDPDKMVYEVTNDVLGLGEGGVIESGPILRANEKKHKH